MTVASERARYLRESGNTSASLTAQTSVHKGRRTVKPVYPEEPAHASRDKQAPDLSLSEWRIRDLGVVEIQTTEDEGDTHTSEQDLVKGISLAKKLFRHQEVSSTYLQSVHPLAMLIINLQQPSRHTHQTAAQLRQDDKRETFIPGPECLRFATP